VIIFGSLWFLLKKKVIKSIFFKKSQNWFKLTGFGSVWFFRTKTGLNRFARFFRFGSVFFPVWVWFGLVFSVSGL